MAKRMRLPNGFGQISKIKNRRLRNPYRAMVTVGKTKEGKPIVKMLKPKAYFRTYNEAYEALLEYHKNPYNPSKDLTLEEVYRMWYEEHEKHVTPAVAAHTRSYWKRCENINGVKIQDIRVIHIKNIIEEIPYVNPKQKVKALLSMVFDYAIEYDIVDKNYPRMYKLKISSETEHHKPLSPEELKYLWDNLGSNPVIEYILVQCYSGWRPTELCDLKLENINMQEWTFTGGSKTKAGRDRTVPIHDSIKRIVFSKYNQGKIEGRKTLFEHKYPWYREKFKEVLPDHSPHDCRSTFITMAKAADMNEYALKRIVGHAINDITEETYTERPIEWLREELGKI